MGTLDTNAKVRELRLIPPYVTFLGFLKARPDGEIAWNWESPNLSPNARIMVADLINKELIKEVEYVVDARAVAHKRTIKLTELGHEVMRAIDAATVKVVASAE